MTVFTVLWAKPGPTIVSIGLTDTSAAGFAAPHRNRPAANRVALITLLVLIFVLSDGAMNDVRLPQNGLGT
jgi:hypothetical protein